MNNTTRNLIKLSIISALYVVLSMITFPIASGFIQFRVSEALCILPLFMPSSAISLFVGCLITNLITGCTVFDVILGSLTSLLAGILTAIIGKKIKPFVPKFIVGGLFPVILNALILPLIWYYLSENNSVIYVLQFVSILISQSVSVYGLGYVLYLAIKKLRLL